MKNRRQILSEWLLAILDGCWALGCLFLGYLALDLPLKVFSSELEKLNLDVVIPPKAPILLLHIVPEAGWSLLIGFVCLAVAYGRLSFATQDSITNRLFRWCVALLMFTLFTACLPLFDMTPLPPPRENSHWLDEAMFVALSLSLGTLAFWPRTPDQPPGCDT